MNKSFEEKNILKLLLKFALPATAGNLIFAMYHLVDRYFIGKYIGSYALSGMTLSFPFTNFIFGLIGLISVGAMNLIPIYFGKNDNKKAQKALGNTIFMYLTTYLIVVILNLLFLGDLLLLFGATEKSLPFAFSYVNILNLGLIFMFLNFGMLRLIRSEGNPKMGMVFALIGCVANIIFDWFFIAVLEWGVKGAAIATVMGNFVGFILVVDYYIIRKKSKIKLDWNALKPDFKLIKESLSIGVSPFMRKLGTTSVMVIITRMLFKYGGDMAVGSFGIIDVLTTLTMLLIGGIGTGAQPIISYNYGARNYKKVKKILVLSMGISTIIATLSFIILYGFGEFIISRFVDDKDLVKVCYDGMKLYIIAMPLLSFQTLGVEFFQAINRPKISVFLNIFRKIILTVPALFIFSILFGLKGVWLTLPIVDIIAAITTFTYIIKVVKELSTDKEDNSEIDENIVIA